MATLTIRNIDTRVKERLRVRAARHSHSMEAELRSILNQALEHDDDGAAPNLAEAIRRRFGPLGGVDLEPHPPLSPAERAAAWREAAKGLPHTPSLPDRSISRKSSYDTRG